MSIDFASRCDEAYDKKKAREKTRAYIGASGIGNECEAAIHFALRGYTDTPPDARLQRVFRDGHRIEDDVVRDMKMAGINVMEVDHLSKRQWEFIGFDGHAIGHADGIAEIGSETWLIEIKSMNDSKFKDFVRNGVKSSHRNYYAQVQFMMGLSKITKCLLVAYNKNNSEYGEEEIEYDELYFSFLSQRVENVLSGKVHKISQDETDWRCRGCFKRGVCWGQIDVPKKIRTCANAMPSENGEFKCKNGCTETCQKWTRWTPLDKT